MHTLSSLRAAAAVALSSVLALGCADGGDLPTDPGLAELNESPDQQIVTLCKTGPAGSWATFRVTATGGELLRGSAVTIDGVQPFGVNPAACVEVWRSTSTATESVTITETAQTAGTMLESLVVFAVGYTADVATATATVEVSSANGAMVIFKNEGTPEEPGLEGCTPGFWKQPQHARYWTGYSRSATFASVFGVSYPGTLLQAVSSGGGGFAALGRHAVAALLNSTSGAVDYPLTTAQVIAGVQAAFNGGDVEEIKDYFEAFNELGCSVKD